MKLYTLLAFSGKPATVHNVQISIDCTQFGTADQSVAESDPGTDYPELR